MNAPKSPFGHSIGKYFQFLAKGQIILLAIVTIILGYFYVITPLGFSIRVFLASSKLTEFYGGFPLNIDQSWEIKPLGNRFFIFYLYKFTSVFVNFKNKILFEEGIKLIYLTIVLLAILIWVYTQRNRLKNYKLSVGFCYLLLVCTFLTLSYYCSLNIEDTCNIILLASIPFILSDNRTFNTISGVFLSLLFPLKGITILLSMYILILVYGKQNYKQKIIYLLSGMIASLAIIFLTLVFVFPHGISDMVDSTLFQGTFIFSFHRLISFYVGLIRVIPYIPVMLIGISITWSLVPLMVQMHDLKNLIKIVLMWITGALVIIVQGTFLNYTYLVLVLPILYSLFLFHVTISQDNFNPDCEYFLPSIIWGLLPVFVVIYLFFIKAIDFPLAFLSCFVFFIIIFYMVYLFLANQKHAHHDIIMPLLTILVIFAVYVTFQFVIVDQGDPLLRIETNREMTKVGNENYQKIINLYDLSNQEEILYLDSGLSAYYIGAPSHSRYFYNLPLQRKVPGLKHSTLYNKSVDNFLDYQGHYIILDNTWFQIDTMDPVLKEKINKEYIKIYNNNNLLLKNHDMILFRKK